MRQEHETAKSFNELKTITQAIQALKNKTPTNATHQESEPTQARTQTNINANTSEITSQRALKPKAKARAKTHALNPTKRAFSERQITAFRDNPQAIANLSYGTKASHNANAFKPEQTNKSNLKAKPSAKALKQGLAKHQENQKGGSDE
ncbi:hypothetical protein KVD17_01350 [Helicobacter pylori]|nr:hypothetical protein KVD17_01350 [Helicobacter pylori]